MLPRPFDDRPWGKERGLDHPYSLGCHAIDTAVMAAALWDRYLTPRQRHVIAHGWGLSETEARQFLICLAGLHDIAKITPGFQACAPAADQVTGLPGYDPLPATFRSPSHQRAAHLVLPELLNRVQGLPLTGRPLNLVAHQIAQIIGGHHGTYPPALSHQGDALSCPLAAVPGLGDKEWDAQRENLIHLIHHLFGTPRYPTRTARGPAAVVTTGLIVLADWLASQLPWIRDRQRRWDTDRTRSWEAHVRRARRAAPKALREAQLTPPTWRRRRTFPTLFPHLRGQKLHPVQESLAKELPDLASGPGLLLITAPPGEGKTEGALFGERIMGPAAGTKGLAFLLPTMATTDAMWTRVRDHTRANCHTPPPVALLHAMAWLDATYTPDDLHSATCDPDTVAEWLRGRHRGFLTGIAVGTWDQAALAVLPHRYMAMRWLGLSGKTIIIDEVHAYDAHGHALTLRLLQWLGALGVPVILLSATVTGDTAAALVHAYRHGAGHTDTPPIPISYPGWTYTDHATGTITTPKEALGSHRAHTLTVNTVDCTHTHNPDNTDGRARAILNLLSPLQETSTGCALIVCNTVADAQATKDLLATAWSTTDRPPLVRLLHARMPARQRAAVTRRIQRWTGRRGKRPTRPFVVISTQIAEQSLDVDFDLVISDLAPLALLLQRAGRGHRHPRNDRPTWAPTGKPRLAVLVPTGQLPPRHWGKVYPQSILRRTRDLLRTLHDADDDQQIKDSIQTKQISVPEDIQDLVDKVYSPEFAKADDIHRIAEDMQLAATATLYTIDPPNSVRDLHPLTNTDQHPDKIATRLGADSTRVLPTYLTADGRHWLHPTHHTHRTALPRQVDPGDRQTIRRLMNATIPINSEWLAGHDPATDPPATWSDVPGLRDLVLLPHPVTRTTIGAYRGDRKTLIVDPENGLVSR
ncbi:CRISPR-associated helicase Cas3' [Streptomyces triculaminicus]|uniref:CRISPR-associated helicase Cas3 n=1 Tax=Streptomyces triculaminicus TaxID=2816232 RepID=A0A939FWB1_9ACTN|nr:CRISPR-associated helicase Cas3' [Streptomyces triculaminicus]MBO0657265.1 CRISPR-associated helicase Cas3' [Streptomyces triculaminicus]